MKALSVLASVCVIMVMTSCAPIMVKTDYDDEVDFRKYTSYDWTDVDEESSKSLMAKRVKAAVERELAEKGHIKVIEEKPDFLISYRVEVT